MTSYRAASALRTIGDRPELQLETALAATPLGYAMHPLFFTGFLARPEIAAAGLLTVADVAAARYFDPTAVRARSLDPVVTASGDRLRFESFSACNGVYARLDLLPDAIDSGEIGFGTTNVDINPPLRAALSRVGRDQLMHLSVGSDSLDVATPDAHYSEREVELPDRWVRGFAALGPVASNLTHRATVPGPQIGIFLNGLPRSAPGPTLHLTSAPDGLRQVVRPTTASIQLAGTSRLSATTRIARLASALDVYGAENGASGWVFHLPGARLTLVLTPEPFRGFSGEGGLLDALALAQHERDSTAAVSELLAWQSRIDPAALAQESDLPEATVRAGLDRLAASGRLGHDLADRTRFHRELPTDPNRVIGDNPRLAGAIALVDAGAVLRSADSWVVRSTDHHQYLDTTPAGLRCSCLWWAKYAHSRGPCKHALAVALFERSDAPATSGKTHRSGPPEP